MEDDQALLQEGGTSDIDSDMSSQFSQGYPLDSSAVDDSQTTAKSPITFVGRNEYPMQMHRARIGHKQCYKCISILGNSDSGRQQTPSVCANHHVGVQPHHVHCSKSLERTGQGRHHSWIQARHLSTRAIPQLLMEKVV